MSLHRLEKSQRDSHSPLSKGTSTPRNLRGCPHELRHWMKMISNDEFVAGIPNDLRLDVEANHYYLIEDQDRVISISEDHESF